MSTLFIPNYLFFYRELVGIRQYLTLLVLIILNREDFMKRQLSFSVVILIFSATSLNCFATTNVCQSNEAVADLYYCNTSKEIEHGSTMSLDKPEPVFYEGQHINDKLHQVAAADGKVRVITFRTSWERI